MKALGFGAILWDEAARKHGDGSGGPAGRSIGGSVFNVIVHLQRLGFDAYMLSAIGKDGLGAETFSEVRRLNVHEEFISSVCEPTCVIGVQFDESGLPHYNDPARVSWDAIEASDDDLERIDRMDFDYLVFGTLEQRSGASRETLRRLLERVHFKSTYMDLTLRGNHYGRDLLDHSLRAARIAKMNEEEAWEVDRLFGFHQADAGGLLSRIRGEFGNEIVCITLGSRGALIGNRTGTFFKPSYAVRIEDTVGSGDAFSAGLIHMLARGSSIEEACDFGNRMGALISSKRGAIPDYTLAELEGMTGVP